MTETDNHGRIEPPDRGDEAAVLIGFLEYQRDTLGWKCSGLDAAALNTPLAPSPMTLGGIMKHLAYVERHWFTRVLFDRPVGAPWDTVDWAADADWDWHSATHDTPEQLIDLWTAMVRGSRELTAEALAGDGTAMAARRTDTHGRSPNLRWILTHMIEEYARHNGHADLIRESIDGQTGE